MILSKKYYNKNLLKICMQNQSLYELRDIPSYDSSYEADSGLLKMGQHFLKGFISFPIKKLTRHLFPPT